PKPGSAPPGLRDEVAEQRKAQQQQEADMHRAYDLAWQRAVGGRPELKQREGEGDPECCLAQDSVAEAGRKSLDPLFRRMRNFELMFAGSGLRRAHALPLPPRQDLESKTPSAAPQRCGRRGVMFRQRD